MNLLARMLSRTLAETAAGGARGPRPRLLDDADQNIGNATLVSPYAEPSALINQNPPRILCLNAESKTGQLITVALGGAMLQPGTALPPFNAGIPIPGGPLVGIVEFGNGSVFTRVEVDIPIGRVQIVGGTYQEPEFGLCMVTVPAGTLRVYARNDGNQLPINVSGNVVKVRDPGEPIVDYPSVAPTSVAGANRAQPNNVQAHATYFTRPSSQPAIRTVHVFSPPSGSAAFAFLTNNYNNSIAIPPFAKSVRILRGDPTLPTFIINFFPTFHTTAAYDSQTVAAGAASPRIPVPQGAASFGLTMTPGAGSIFAEFEIGV